MPAKHSIRQPAVQPNDLPGRHARGSYMEGARHLSSGVQPAAPHRPIRPAALRPRMLLAVLTALTLLTASTVYATVQAGPAPAGRSSAAPESGSGAISAAGTDARPPAFVLPRTATAPAPAVFPQVTPGVVVPSGPAGPGPMNTATTAPAEDPSPRDGDVIPARAVTPIGPQLEERINAIIAANTSYDLGIALIDVSDDAIDDAVHEYGVPSGFVAASTGKILAAAALYHRVESGQGALTDRLGSSTAGVQIRQMVQQSNNDSWALILGVLGKQGLRDYAAGLGIDYDRSVNALTPADMARILALLHRGDLLNPQNTAQLLSYMQNTNYETLIPAAVPPGVAVFHKYGLLSANLHDAAILAQEGRAFVLVVYTRGRGLSDMDARAAVIREVAAVVSEALF
ncbi:serine hydrolase [Arthrobacter oryzae]|nr:serine hydrolase [Arthrobacter oryzae]